MEKITDIREIQNIELEIMKYVDRICKENNLVYSLSGGTALGAIRHKGFIPWDDDIDIMMPRKDYEKFLKIMDEQNDKNYYCLHYGKENIFYPFAKVVDLNTELTEINRIKNPNHGVYIDIFPIDNMPEKNLKKLIKKHHRLQTLGFMAASEKFKTSKGGVLRTIAKIPCFAIAKMFGWKYWIKKEMKLYEKVNKVSANNIGFYGGYNEREIMPANLFDEIIDVEFENNKFKLVKNYDYYLSSLFGDYMTPPPKEKQITHHDFVAYKK